MPKPRKSTEATFYDLFDRFPLSEQKIILRVLDRLVIGRELDEKRATQKGEQK